MAGSYVSDREGSTMPPKKEKRLTKKEKIQKEKSKHSSSTSCDSSYLRQIDFDVADQLFSAWLKLLSPIPEQEKFFVRKSIKLCHDYQELRRNGRLTSVQECEIRRLQIDGQSLQGINTIKT